MYPSSKRGEKLPDMKENIALIGFMGSGKTTVGRVLAKQLDMKFVDVDKVIAAQEKKSIFNIFQERGEQYFRQKEREIILQESTKNNVVIATGGGVVIDNENIKNLQNTCFIVYLDADVSCIYERVKNSKHRPLLQNIENLQQHIETLLEKRKFLYEFSSDYKIKIYLDSNLYDTVEEIKKVYIDS